MKRLIASLLMLICVPFLLWSGNSSLRSGGVSSGGTVNGALTIVGDGNNMGSGKQYTKVLTLLGENGTSNATKGGQLVLTGGGGSGPENICGIEIENSPSYGWKIYPDNSGDFLGIAGRYNSATWTPWITIKQQTGLTTFAGGASLAVKTSAQVVAIDPIAIGECYKASAADGIYVSTGTGVGQFGYIATIDLP